MRSTLLLKQFSAMSAATATERALKRAASFNEALARRGGVYVEGAFALALLGGGTARYGGRAAL